VSSIKAVLATDGVKLSKASAAIEGTKARVSSSGGGTGGKGGGTTGIELLLFVVAAAAWARVTVVSVPLMLPAMVSTT
jgi:hypothetical protein